LKISRTTLAFVGGAALAIAPLLLLAGSFMFGQEESLNEMGALIDEGANKAAKTLSIKQLLGSILMLLFVLGFMGGGVAYLLVCLVGVILILVLRELHEIRKAIES
jgi:uncharacterized membrane protein